MPLLIRPAVSEDAPTICEFNRSLAKETENKVLDPAVLAAGVAEVLKDPSKGRYWVALDADKIVGQIMVTTEWTDWRNGWFWWIQSVYVRSEARRRGVFRALYKYVYDTALREKIVGLRLYVEEHNVSAQKTYADLGMEKMSFFLYHRWPLAIQAKSPARASE